MLAFRPDLEKWEYWEQVLIEPKIWENKKADGTDVYSTTEEKVVKATDCLARSIYLQGNGGMADVYTSYKMAF
jgi:hypothetical protein